MRRWVRARRQGSHDDAASRFAKSIQANSGFSSLYAFHAGALGPAGRINEAKSVARRLLAFSLFARPELVGVLCTGLRLADVPESRVTLSRRGEIHGLNTAFQPGSLTGRQ
jgi:hypothetical protein